MRDTKIKQNGGNGRYMVFLIQLDVVDGDIIETVIDMKDFKQKTRAENFKRKWDNEITYDRNVKMEIQATLDNQNRWA
jgi:hypothetical protein